MKRTLILTLSILALSFAFGIIFTYFKPISSADVNEDIINDFSNNPINDPDTNAANTVDEMTETMDNSTNAANTVDEMTQAANNAGVGSSSGSNSNSNSGTTSNQPSSSGSSGQTSGASPTSNALSLLPTKAEASSALKAKLETIFKLAFGTAGAIFVVMFIIGGLQYLSAGSNEESAEKAKKLLINSVIGIIIVVGAYAIAAYILTKIGGTVPSIISP